MADFLTEKISEMDRRLEELRPLHDEYLRLERARAALGEFDSSSPACLLYTSPSPRDRS